MLSALTAILSKFDQQRAGGGGTETVRRELAQSRPGLADGSDGSTLAGNLTVLGSIANLIVVQRAAAGGITIGVWDCCRVGVPLTLLTLLVGTIWLRI